MDKNETKCEECGKEGCYKEQEDLCDFCYIAKHNLGQRDVIRTSIDEDEDENGDSIYVKELTELAEVVDELPFDEDKYYPPGWNS